MVTFVADFVSCAYFLFSFHCCLLIKIMLRWVYNDIFQLLITFVKANTIYVTIADFCMSSTNQVKIIEKKKTRKNFSFFEFGFFIQTSCNKNVCGFARFLDLPPSHPSVSLFQPFLFLNWKRSVEHLLQYFWFGSLSHVSFILYSFELTSERKIITSFWVGGFCACFLYHFKVRNTWSFSFDWSNEKHSLLKKQKQHKKQRWYILHLDYVRSTSTTKYRRCDKITKVNSNIVKS